MIDSSEHPLPPPLGSETQNLVRAVAPLSSAAIDAMQTRVLARLEGNENAAHLTPQRRPRPLPWVALATLLLGSAAAALYWNPAADAVAPPLPTKAPLAPREELPSSPRSEKTEAAKESTGASERAQAGDPDLRPRPSKSASEKAKVSPLYEAAHLLRKQKKPAEALAQLNRLDPATQNSEEALALRMESLFMMGSPDAKNVARRYLARFPLGRYRMHAERIQGGKP